MLTIENLTKYYGKTRGVEKLSFEIIDGEVFGFIGPNGAGKSTTIRCIMNTINRNSGSIKVNGVEATKKNTQLKLDIGYLPGEIHLYDELTVKNMLSYAANFYEKDCNKRINELVTKLDIDVKKKIGDLSFGNLKKVGIVLAMMHEPKFLIFDEPSSGLDPLIQEAFFELLKEEKEKGTTVFYSSHVLSEVKRICDRVGIIKDGHLVKVETIENLVDQHFLNVTVRAKDIAKVKELFEEDVVEETSEFIKVMYKDDINILLKKLSKLKVEKVLIEEPSIEEIFMHYYK